MIRYTKQGDHYSCGAAALVNALKWAGYKISWRDEKKEWLKTAGTERIGTSAWLLNIAIRKFFPDSKRQRPHIAKIEAHLRSGGAVIVNTRWTINKSKRGSHWALVDEMSYDNEHFWVINYYEEPGPARRRIARKELLAHLKGKHTYDSWYI